MLTPQAGKVVLDTSAVVRHFRQQASLDVLLSQADEIILPHVALGELLYGAFNADKKWREETLNQVNLFSSAVTIAYPTENTVKAYATTRLDLKKRGSPIPDNDIWIAAIALQSSLPLYANDNHFEHVKGLDYIKV